MTVDELAELLDKREISWRDAQVYALVHIAQALERLVRDLERRRDDEPGRPESTSSH